ncbi:DoxX family protein [Mucilaginibacter agri]|uniref:DoxX family membrane protein n=1 Tax=Mucilaginibacter agri TaxID=2695265 RepID=A0A965ZJ80_9SPHI|nr:DoxX family protein [Mucilaginibacter agri]NCD71067.1 DoxX family membrane protein [Mucilaginibacter agri]
MNKTTYLLLRLAIGTSMFAHGLVRLPKLHGFSNWMLGSFSKSMIPLLLVRPFSYALPIAEFTIGLLILIGLFTRQALFAGGVVMILLLFGTCMIENWNAINTQLIHIAFFAVLIQWINYNTFAVENKIKNTH